MGDIVQGLLDYLENTPREQVLKDWAEFAYCDEVEGPLAIDFINHSKQMYINNDLQEIFEKYYEHVQTSLALGEEPLDIERFNRKLEREYDEQFEEYQQRSEDYAVYRQACLQSGDPVISFYEFCQL